MSGTWHREQALETTPISPAGWFRAALRGAAIVTVMLVGLILLLLTRLFERPIWGLDRPWTPHITTLVCRVSLTIMGLKHRSIGVQMTGIGAVVANHSTWLDILVLNARKRVYFVAKSEVAGWPGIGVLARATGTVFVRRNRADAMVQKQIFETRLKAGHKLLFFPEGTSTDGTLILPFKSTLFAAFLTDELKEIMQIQPVTVSYQSPDTKSPGFYGWWGDMDLGPHLLLVLAERWQGSVTITYHDPIKVADFTDRKKLALACELAVRSGLET